MGSNSKWRRFQVIRDFASLFFPRYCLGCANSLVGGEEVLCTRCIIDLPRTDYHQHDSPVKDKLTGRLPVKHGLAFLKFRKGGVVQQLLHEMKYNQHPEIAEKFGKIYGQQLFRHGYQGQFDLIIPVPLHPTRLRKRGYNQSALFAFGLSHSLGIPWDEHISVRTQKTVTQTRKSKAERWDNVKNVFDVANGEFVKGRRILLVDDVITTGATLEACGQQLINHGCIELSVACIAEAQ